MPGEELQDHKPLAIGHSFEQAHLRTRNVVTTLIVSHLHTNFLSTPTRVTGLQASQSIRTQSLRLVVRTSSWNNTSSSFENTPIQNVSDRAATAARTLAWISPFIETSPFLVLAGPTNIS